MPTNPPERREARPRPRSRVILGATCYSDAEAALGLATELARQVGADLHGVLVRDEAILCAATAAPCAGVVSYSGVRVSGVTAEAMLGAFAADARRFRQQLERRATAAALHCAFQEVGGRLSETVLRTAARNDVVVFGVRRTIRDDSALVVVLNADTGVPAFAGTLARRLNKRLVALTPGAADTDVSETRHYDNPAELLTMLDRMSPAAVVLTSGPDGLPPLGRLVEAARCPVILSRPRDDVDG